MIIKSDHIFLENGEFSGYVKVEGKKIVDILDSYDGIVDYDFTDKRVIPGIIDIHNHGFGGWSMTDSADKAIVEGYVKALTTIGVTCCMPTAKEEAFEAIADVYNSEYRGARIYGIHSEGPFWARGGENTVGMSWPLPDVEETKRLVSKAKGAMKMMAIAVELPNAYDVIRYLHSENIKVACCHTKSMAEDIRKANKEVKIDISTHLGNGMQGMHHRNVGALGGLLLEDDIWYEVITDLNHICADMLKIFFKLQPYDKFCLISDSNFIAGLPVGTYIRYGREMYADEKGLILNSDGRICGSGKWVMSNMGKLEKVVGVPFDKVVQMASLNPARFLNIDNHTGSIKIGKDADITVMDEDYNCLFTMVNGVVEYDAKVDKQEDYFNKEALKLKVA